MLSDVRLSDLIAISPAYHTEVNIQRDFCDARKIEGYVPNSASRLALSKIVVGLMPNSQKRAHLVTGAYGAGKSHFGLVVSALVRRLPAVDPVLNKLRERDKDVAVGIQQRLGPVKKFLVVVTDIAQYSQGFNHALLVGLQDALTREGVEFRPASYYLEAINVIRRWKQAGQKNPSDDAYQELREALLKRGALTPEMLIGQLDKCSEEHYVLFQEVHREVAHGAPFWPLATAVPRDLYKETIAYLRKSGEWEGIWVICDEFGEYLRTMAKDLENPDSRDIGAFTEYCKGSGEHQCHLMLIAHQSLADYAVHSLSQKDWQKLSGRFQDSEHPLATSGATREIIEMISMVLTKRDETGQERERWREVFDHPDVGMMVDDLLNAGIYRMETRQWLRESLVGGCCPLHPFASYCLPSLAQKLGQRERTLFGFLAGDGDAGLKAFADGQPLIGTNGRLNLFTTDRLVAYFGPEASEKVQETEYRQIMKAREQALGAAPGSALAKRIIDTLTVFAIVGPQLPPAEDNLIAALHLSPVEAEEARNVLTELAARKAIRKRASSGFYELRRGHGELDVEDELARLKTEMRPAFDPLAALHDIGEYAERLAPFEAPAYYANHRVTRLAKRQVVLPASLSNPKEYTDAITSWYEPSRKKYVADLSVLYALADDAVQLDQAERLASAASCRHPQLVVAVPRQPAHLLEKLLDWTVARTLRHNLAGSSDKHDSDLEDLDVALEEHKATILKGLEQFLQADNLRWYCNGEVRATLAPGKESDYISALMESAFGKTPAVKDDIAEVSRGKDMNKKDRQHVIAHLLEDPGPIRVRKVGGSAEDRILRNCLRDTEVLVKKQDADPHELFEVRDELPEGAPLYEVWALFRQELMKEGQSTILGRPVRRLLKPPYGLSSQLIEVLLGAFFRNRLDEFAVRGNVERFMKSRDSSLLKPVKITCETLAAIVANPDDYGVVYGVVHPVEREYIKRIIQSVGEPATADKNAGAGMWEDGKSILLAWFDALPAITRAAADHGTHANALGCLLRDASEVKAKDLFKASLPKALGVTLSPSARKDEVEEIITRFREGQSELDNYAENRAMELIGQLAWLFEAKGGTRDELIQGLNRWYSQTLTEDQRIHKFLGTEGALKQAIVAEGPIDTRLLETMPRKMDLPSYKDWRGSDTARLFMTQVALAKKTIEDWHPVVVAPKPSITPVTPVEPPKVPLQLPKMSLGTGSTQPGIVPPPGHKIAETPAEPFGDPKRLAKQKIKSMLRELNMPDAELRSILTELLSELKT